MDAHPATVRPLYPGGLLVSLPHRPFSRCLLGIWTWQMRLFACQRLTHRSPFRTRLRWPSLWCWTTASGIFCVASALQCGWPSWMTSGLRPAVPHLSALASRFTLHQFAVQHLLCPLFVFRLLSPVTDSDKLIKAHETKNLTCRARREGAVPPDVCLGSPSRRTKHLRGRAPSMVTRRCLLLRFIIVPGCLQRAAG